MRPINIRISSRFNSPANGTKLHKALIRSRGPQGRHSILGRPTCHPRWCLGPQIAPWHTRQFLSRDLTIAIRIQGGKYRICIGLRHWGGGYHLRSKTQKQGQAQSEKFECAHLNNS